ncbi:MAG: hypothetical protein WBB31_04805 [Saprospiraceae bacterium]
MPSFSPALSTEYQTMFDSCAINPTHLQEVETIITKINNNAPRYKIIESVTMVPWYFIGVLHTMESGMNFNTHMHNGDPLTGRTVQVPKGRPVSGNPPFTFEESAIDAMKYKKFHQQTSWELPQILYRLEKYNGFGYMEVYHISSPYLWAGSNHYIKGKYVADGQFSSTAVSKQIGAAVLLRRMAENGLIHFQGDDLKAKEYARLVNYDPSHFNQYAVELQKYLNTFPGIYLNPDGKAGPKTSEAFKKIFGIYLNNDPRIGL